MANAPNCDVKSVVSKLRELRPFADCQSLREVICQNARHGLLQSATRNRGRQKVWQSNPSAENADAFYVRMVRPLRRLQRRGVVEKLQEITSTDDRTPIAVEIIGQVNITK